MDVLTSSGFAHTLQTVAFATIIFAACVLLPKINYRTQLAKLPAYGSPASEKQRQAYLKSAAKMYREGYEKVSLSRPLGIYSPHKPVVQRHSVPHGIS